MKSKKIQHYGLSLLAAGAALYGVTATVQAHAATLTTLVEFNNNTAPKGLNPWGSLVQGTDGNFYGLTEQGGANSSGTAFQMTPAGVLTTLVEFNNTSAPKGLKPRGSLVQGTDGNFYGLAQQGGANHYGTAFQMTPAGGLTTLVEFNRYTAPKGRYPQGSLVQGTDGNFYGLTQQGGANDYGTAFKMTAAGGLTTLVEFNDNTAPKGHSPLGSLVQGTDGNFYGLTKWGGANGAGTAFRMTPAGGLTTLVEFNDNTAPKGSSPQGSLVQGTDGNFYGLTQLGGANGAGTAFRMTPSGVLSTLVEFNGFSAPLGHSPYGSLVQGADGNFYGLTFGGGANGAGTAFQMTPAGVLSTLVNFNSNTAPKGSSPMGSLVQAADGNFYGMTQYGGANDSGTAFKLEVTPNSAPTDITLSTSSVAENQAIGTTVGTLAATDVDAGDTATFTLVTGTGDTDNASFSIGNGTDLLTAATFDYEVQSTYGIRVRVTDSANNTFEKQFTIAVAQVPVVAIVKSGGNAIISWPADATGYVLDQTATLVGLPIPWTLVPQNTYQTNGSNVSVTVPVGLDNQFFRLRKQ